jgi:hypothetical protein
MNPKTEVFFCLLYCAISDTALNEKVRNQFKTEYLEDFYSMAKKHDVAHLIAYVLSKEGLIEKESPCFDEFKKAQVLAGYRYERNKQEQELLEGVLNEADIPYILLKGAVISQKYPQGWMRTSSDIDVLVKKEDFDRAVNLLTQKRNYTKNEVYTHDVSLYNEDGVHIELHHCLIEENIVTVADKILDKVWDNLDQDGKMNDEFFYFYFIAHTAKHFQHGGCGIKPLLDLWILENKSEANPKCDALLEQGGLLKFKQYCIKLIDVWFFGEPCDEFSKKLTRYILNGGVYGKKSSTILVGRAKSGGRLKYVLSRAFIPYEVIRYQFPVLNKHKYLMPLFQVVRWFKILFRGNAGDELKINANLKKDQLDEINEILNQLGI